MTPSRFRLLLGVYSVVFVISIILAAIGLQKSLVLYVLGFALLFASIVGFTATLATRYALRKFGRWPRPNATDLPNIAPIEPTRPPHIAPIEPSAPPPVIERQPDRIEVEPVFATSVTEIEPADGAVVHGTDTWVRWRTSGHGAARVMWRESGREEFRNVPASGDDPVVAPIGPLKIGRRYEYMVEEAIADVVSRSGLRTFEVQPGLMFDPPSFETIVARDYDQRVSLMLKNRSATAISVGARALQFWEDLPADIVGPGSIDDPAQLQPGGTLKLELAVTAPDATRETYDIPVEASGTFATVRVRVPRPPLKLSLRVVSEDPRTLAKTIEIRNDGETIGDLAIRVVEPDDADLRLQPTVNHAYLKRGESIQLVATPVLYLEFRSLKAEIECASAGQHMLFALDFRAPPGMRLLGVRTGSAHTSSTADWYCTNRPNILLDILGLSALGPAVDLATYAWDEITKMREDALMQWAEELWWVHLGLDLAGLFPVLGAAPDSLNAGLYVIEGDMDNAKWATAAILPVLGAGATVTKLGVRASRKIAKELGKDALAKGIKEAVERSGRPTPKPPHLKQPTEYPAGWQKEVAALKTKFPKLNDADLLPKRRGVSRGSAYEGAGTGHGFSFRGKLRDGTGIELDDITPGGVVVDAKSRSYLDKPADSEPGSLLDPYPSDPSDLASGPLNTVLEDVNPEKLLQRKEQFQKQLEFVRENDLNGLEWVVDNPRSKQILEDFLDELRTHPVYDGFDWSNVRIVEGY